MRPVVLFSLIFVIKSNEACTPSKTTVSGTHASKSFCSGELIFEDNFDNFDLEKWQHEITLAGGGNHEFQWYTNNRTNSFTKNGLLYIRPSLTADQFGEAFLSSGTLNIDGGGPSDRCTNPTNYGCERMGSPTQILNPIKSARIRTVDSFSFCYGRLEIRAWMPSGDWLWPAIWLLPTKNAYSTWPASGEIDLVESRGNKEIHINGANIGANEFGSTLHYGPFAAFDVYENAHFTKNDPAGYDTGFHRYQLEWTPEYIKFSIDDAEIGRVSPPDGGFWQFGGFDKYPGLENPWRYASKMAPFDQKFHILINLAVGGFNFFPDEASYPRGKPWRNFSPTAMTDFWNGRSNWLPTWKLKENDGESASLKVDYVRVWAL